MDIDLIWGMIMDHCDFKAIGALSILSTSWMDRVKSIRGDLYNAMDALMAAVIYNEVELVKLTIKEVKDYGSILLANNLAAQNGHLECLKILHNNLCNFGFGRLTDADQAVGWRAVEAGHIDCALYIFHTVHPNQWLHGYLKAAIHTRNVDALKTFLRFYVPLDHVEMFLDEVYNYIYNPRPFDGLWIKDLLDSWLESITTPDERNEAIYMVKRVADCQSGTVLVVYEIVNKWLC